MLGFSEGLVEVLNPKPWAIVLVLSYLGSSLLTLFDIMSSFIFLALDFLIKSSMVLSIRIDFLSKLDILFAASVESLNNDVKVPQCVLLSYSNSSFSVSIFILISIFN